MLFLVVNSTIDLSESRNSYHLSDRINNCLLFHCYQISIYNFGLHFRATGWYILCKLYVSSFWTRKTQNTRNFCNNKNFTFLKIENTRFRLYAHSVFQPNFKIFLWTYIFLLLKKGCSEISLNWKIFLNFVMKQDFLIISQN